MFACLDIETNEWNHQNLKLHIIFGYLCYYSEKNRLRKVLFHTAKEVFEDIEKIFKITKKPFLIFAHNSDYDTKFLLNYASSHYELKIIDNGCMYSLKVFKSVEKTHRNGQSYKKLIKICEFRNSLRLFPMKLSEMGQFCKLKKLERKFTEENDSFHRYCQRDCDIIYKSLRYLIKFFQSIDFPMTIEKIPMTFPSIAYRYFHKMNSEFEIIDDQSRKKNQLSTIADWINNYFRGFYFGGRCEVFDMNIHKEVAYLDINSLYPFCMIHNKFPKPKYRRTKDFNFTENTFAVLCNIDESRENIPIIAEKMNGKLLFMARKKQSLLTIEEYLYILKNRFDTTIEIIERWDCDGWITPFEYLKQIHKMKQEYKKEGNPFNIFCKYILNSTYGKFAENPEKSEATFYKISDLTSEKTKILLSKAKYYKWEDNYLIVYNTNMVSHLSLNVVFAHRITALSRLNLVQYIDTFIKLGIKCLYCDTDSIVTDTKNLDRLTQYLDEYELGKMKIEKIYRRFCALAPKEYLFVEKLKNGEWKQQQKAKGISDCSLFDYYTNKGVDMIRPTKYRECIKRSIDYESAIEINKKKTTFYDKRILYTDYSTIPINEYNDTIEKDNKELILRQMEKYKEG